MSRKKQNRQFLQQTWRHAAAAAAALNWFHDMLKLEPRSQTKIRIPEWTYLHIILL